jgi:bifunctional UDP-N-acetylglucosamine pyrophosphorylase/glucosamine-1-phosphate N-acetyltransferase
VRCALEALPASGPVLVLAGDTPLVQAASLRRLLQQHRGLATVATFEVGDPTGYGRIIQDAGGIRIVEQGECSPEQAAIRQVNSGAYVFEAAWLRQELPLLRPHPPKGEYYLTDLVGSGAVAVSGFSAEEFMGINDRAALADARMRLRRRVNRAWALAGVDFADLETIEVEAGVQLEADAHLGMGTILKGACRVAGKVGPNCLLVDTVVERGAEVKAGTVAEGAWLAAGAQAGPMTHLRPGARLEAKSKVGNFVEVKNAVLGVGAKASHLSYLGDAVIGEEANIGAGTITCNYDGFRKHRTEIGARAFIGSNTALVAPVSVGEGAIVGAGTIVTQEVPADAIAVGRPPLKLSPGSAARFRERLSALMRKNA